MLQIYVGLQFGTPSGRHDIRFQGECGGQEKIAAPSGFRLVRGLRLLKAALIQVFGIPSGSPEGTPGQETALSAIQVS